MGPRNKRGERVTKNERGGGPLQIITRIVRLAVGDVKHGRLTGDIHVPELDADIFLPVIGAVWGRPTHQDAPTQLGPQIHYPYQEHV